MPERLYGVCAARHQLKIEHYADSGYYLNEKTRAEGPNWHWSISDMDYFYRNGALVGYSRDVEPPDEPYGSEIGKFEALRRALDLHHKICKEPVHFLSKVMQPYGAVEEDPETVVLAGETTLPLPYDVQEEAS